MLFVDHIGGVPWEGCGGMPQTPIFLSSLKLILYVKAS